MRIPVPRYLGPRVRRMIQTLGDASQMRVTGEVLTESSDAVTRRYQTVYPFQAGTTAVYVGGVRYVGEQVYEEVPGRQEIQFTTAPKKGLRITVDYEKA